MGNNMSDAIAPESKPLPSAAVIGAAEGALAAPSTPPRPFAAGSESVASTKASTIRAGDASREGGGGKKTGRLIGVRVAASGMVYRFISLLQEIKVGDAVLLHGKAEEESVGWVVFVLEENGEESFQERLFTGGFAKIVRVLSGAERRFFDPNNRTSGQAALESRAKTICQAKIQELQLPMRLSKVQYLLGGSKLLVYFTAESRVDFRELVRILGSRLKARVEMRHIGVRDEAKLLGGLGLCGREFCCSSHLKRFHPVSVRMAKNQELSLNPEGISGACGRLLCCLEYENSTYQALREGLPKIKQSAQTLDGRQGVVYAVHPLTGTVDLQLTDGTRACCARCELRGGEGGGDGAQQALPLLEREGKKPLLEGAVPPQESREARLADAKSRRSASVAKGGGRGNRSRRPESGKKAARSGSVPWPVEAKQAPAGPPSVAVPPLSGTPDGQAPPARKKRRRRRSSAKTTTEQKSSQ